MSTSKKVIAYIAKCPIGWFGFTEDGILTEYFLFSSDPYEAAEEFLGSIPEIFISSLKKKFSIIEESEKAQKFLRSEMRSLAKKLGFFKSDKNLNSFISLFAIALSRRYVLSAISRDKIIVQATNALDDLSKVINSLNMRLSEWFALHYPEVRLSGKRLAELVANYGLRDNWPDFKGSVGVEITRSDEKALKDFAKLIIDINREKDSLEKYVKQSITEIMPNVSSILEPLIASRLLSLAGSAEKLAKMSASTIQLIGAEKALFRALRKQGKAPKYGIIFLSKWIQSAPEEERGKVARLLAAKIMMAARIDFYSKRDESRRLMAELEEQIKK